MEATHPLEEYGVRLLVDDSYRIEDEGEGLTIYTERDPAGAMEAIVDERIPDSWESDYEGGHASISSNEPPCLVPGTKKYWGLVQEADRYHMSIDRDPGSGYKIEISRPELMRRDDIFQVTSTILEGLFDLEMGRSRV
ncbi:MAG: hypothetical protein MUP63_03320 [Candidatus Nanohaloarchaeota archaeon QJJ-7]|nr:hypothetical protein [Candidatus Nanohaloarchaeota archaeon QJJ-7]